jgi:hypothetical protein
MNIQAKTNEELRTKLSNTSREKFFMVQIEKTTAGLVVANEKLSIQNKEKRSVQPINHHNKELTFQNKEKKKIRQQISCCQYHLSK